MFGSKSPGQGLRDVDRIALTRVNMVSDLAVRLLFAFQRLGLREGRGHGNKDPEKQRQIPHGLISDPVVCGNHTPQSPSAQALSAVT